MKVDIIQEKEKAQKKFEMQDRKKSENTDSISVDIISSN